MTGVAFDRCLTGGYSMLANEAMYHLFVYNLFDNNNAFWMLII